MLLPSLFVLKTQRTIPSSRFYERFRKGALAEKLRVAISAIPDVTGLATAKSRSAHELATRTSAVHAGHIPSVPRTKLDM